MASLLRPGGRARRWLWWPAASPKSGRVPALRGPLDVQWGEGQLGGRLEPAEDGEGEDLEGPGALSRASRASLFGSCLGHTQPCHLPVIWAPDGASGLHEVESVGLARTVREIPLALVHHFSMDQDESPWQGHSRSGEHSGQEGTWWAVPSLKQWCGFFVPLLIPGTSGPGVCPGWRLCGWTWVPPGSSPSTVARTLASLGSGIAFCGISRTRQKPAGASPGNTVLELSFPFLKERVWDFPGSPMVKNLPSHAGDASSIPGWGTKISTCPKAATCMARLLSPHVITDIQCNQININIKIRNKRKCADNQDFRALVHHLTHDISLASPLVWGNRLRGFQSFALRDNLEAAASGFQPSPGDPGVSHSAFSPHSAHLTFPPAVTPQPSGRLGGQSRHRPLGTAPRPSSLPSAPAPYLSALVWAQRGCYPGLAPTQGSWCQAPSQQGPGPSSSTLHLQARVGPSASLVSRSFSHGGGGASQMAQW